MVMVRGAATNSGSLLAGQCAPRSIHCLIEAISLSVDCQSQEEVDDLWEKLTEGGSEDQCGWLNDKFGLSWQIVPRALPELLGDPDPEKSKRVMEAMLKMKKIDIKALQEAYAG